VTDREELLVELVDNTGRAVGSCSVAEAHTPPGRQHRAFSVFLQDAEGRLLLQQRAEVKTRFAGRWSNTCCGHPAPGEAVVDGASKRLADEMGLTASLTEVGVYAYQAGDAASGRIEYEWDHVVIGRLNGEVPAPDPAEVSDYTWIEPERLWVAIVETPDLYTPWLAGVLRVAGSGG
jgi:isopentenyl-diphosphate delta-isomerase